MDILFLLVGALTAYFNYRTSKLYGNVDEKVETEKAVSDIPNQKPIPDNATRLERIAHWLGLEDI